MLTRKVASRLAHDGINSLDLGDELILIILDQVRYIHLYICEADRRLCIVIAK